jgi:perosamine synthetase
MSDAARNSAIPRHPVLGWSAFSGRVRSPLPSVDELPQVVYTTSGHAAIALALRVLGCRAGDRVLVPTYHCPTMISPVVLLGAVPVFYPLTADGEPSMDWLAQHAEDVRAMLVAHYFGFVHSLAESRAFCDARGIALVEDCAHAFFGAAGDRPVGSWGDLAIASLTKFFPVPAGGCLVSGRRQLPDLALRPPSGLDELRAALDAVELGARYRRFPGLNALLRAGFGAKELVSGRRFWPVIEDDYDNVRPPSVSELNEDLVRFSLARSSRRIARRVPRARIVELRRRNYAMLSELLRDLPAAAVYRPDLPNDSAPYVFPLEVHHPQARYRALRAARLPLLRWDRVWPGVPSIAGDYGTRWATSMFQLACHQDLTESDVRAIAATVRRVFNEVE